MLVQHVSGHAIAQMDVQNASGHERSTPGYRSDYLIEQQGSHVTLSRRFPCKQTKHHGASELAIQRHLNFPRIPRATAAYRTVTRPQ
jgi:hypothetical protein